ncbi:thioredoxin reductase (NADPH) [Paenibacillus taihuensis]|uniref:Thioredoxin reductase (NADPH) n=2 Tax=Paenibacillus taihuensis TaxID=1156355 RepID=A0A3D9RWP0_9BACL|nr:thioredoxin reductase (NADPH) [Paenibacillus taihuensis]
MTYRKESLKGHEAEVSKLVDNGVDCLLNTEIEKLIAPHGQEAITHVLLRNNEDDAKVEMPVDEVIICHGYDYQRDLLDNSKVRIQMKDEWNIAGTPMSETSVPGIYAAGDLLAHEGKLHLIAGAFQDAANAVNKAKKFITPEAEEYGMVSSHNDRFIERNRKLKKQLFGN